MAYHRAHGVNTGSSESSTRTGPACVSMTVALLPALMGQALRNEPMTIFGDGSQTRSFCFVTDWSKASCGWPAVPNTIPLNIGNPSESRTASSPKRSRHSFPVTQARSNNCPCPGRSETPSAPTSPALGKSSVGTESRTDRRTEANLVTSSPNSALILHPACATKAIRSHPRPSSGMLRIAPFFRFGDFQGS